MVGANCSSKEFARTLQTTNINATTNEYNLAEKNNTWRKFVLEDISFSIRTTKTMLFSQIRRNSFWFIWETFYHLFVLSTESITLHGKICFDMDDVMWYHLFIVLNFMKIGKWRRNCNSVQSWKLNHPQTGTKFTEGKIILVTWCIKVLKLNEERN
jgi:hypothetical protein